MSQDCLEVVLIFRKISNYELFDEKSFLRPNLTLGLSVIGGDFSRADSTSRHFCEETIPSRLTPACSSYLYMSQDCLVIVLIFREISNHELFDEKAS